MVKAMLKKGTHSMAQRWHVYTFIYLVRTGYLSHPHELLNHAHKIISLSEYI